MFPSVFIIGARQCGKSTFVKESFASWKYYSLKDSDHYQLIFSNLKTFFELNPDKVIIDEAQIIQRFSLLRALSNFLNDTKSPVGLLVNTSDRIEQLTANIFQIPVTYF